MPRLPRKVNIVEARLRSDHASEADFLRAYLQVLDVVAEVTVVRSKRDLMRELSRPQASHVHISMHGARTDSGTALMASDDAVFGTDDLSALQGLLQWRIVVSTACFGGSADLARTMLATGCRRYVAPRRQIPWPDAAIFSALLYRAHFDRGLSVEKAFALAKEHGQSKGDWTCYAAGNHQCRLL